MKDVHQKSKRSHVSETHTSMSSLELQREPSKGKSIAVSHPVGKPSSLAQVSLALSVSAVGLLLSEHQQVQAVEVATLEKFQDGYPDSQGETFMIPAPVTLATAPEAQPTIESSQLVAAAPTTVNRIEPERPAIKHLVEADETFWSLAQRYGVSAKAIAQLNNLSLESTLSLGQSVKIPTTFDQPMVVAPTAVAVPEVAPEVASVDLSPRVIAPSVEDLQLQEDEAIATLRAKQENLAESIEQTQDEPITLVFDAEAANFDAEEANTEKNSVQKQPDTVISSTAVDSAVSTKVPEDSAVIIPVPLPEQPATKREAEVHIPQEVLLSNRAVSSESRLPEPPGLQLPNAAPELESASEAVDVVEANANPLPEVEIEATVPEPVTVFSVNSPTTVVAAASLNQQTHTVRPGETLYAIARRYGISGRELIAANRLDNPNVIKVNQTLVIPTADNNGGHNSGQNNFVALLPSTEATQSINRDSQTLANTTNLSVAAPLPSRSSRGDDELAIKFDVAAESAVNQLRDDIAKMRQSYQEQRVAAVESPKAQTTIEFTLNADSEHETTVLNPEWKEEANVEANSDVLPEAPQQLAAASQADIANYNSLLRLSVGETVSPELPALSNPEDYIPGEEVFNGYIWPSQGVLTSGYGRRWGRMHRGIDIAAPVGTPIFAAAGGEVITAGWNSGGYGNLVKVKHSDGSVTLYAHNSRILVRKGQKVKQGQQIAAMGSTGFSTGPHLHFEIHRPGQGAKNPVAFLPNR